MPYKDYEQFKAKLRQRHADRRAWFIDLLGGKCNHCGVTEKLEFDHVDPTTKVFTISTRLANRSKAALATEIVKCQLLCFDCHRLKDEVDNGKSKHGTRSMYVNYKCRCIGCKNANTAYTEKLRER